MPKLDAESRAALNWARLARVHENGEVQYRNLRFELRNRTVTRRAIQGFTQYLERTGRYVNRIRQSDPKWHTATLSALREIANYCAVSSTRPPVPRQAPRVSPRVLAKTAPDKQLVRVIQQDKIITNYMLYAQTGLRVNKPAMTREATNWVLAKTLIKDSAKTRQELEKRAAAAASSGKWVNFFTVSCKYPPPTKVSKANAATWACMKLGLIHKKNTELALLTFELGNMSGHWRPTTFSSGGYPAFCATDHRDGFGRTMPLRGQKWGLTELVVADDGPIALSDCIPLGEVSADTMSLVDSARIVSDLRRRTRL